ncbi:12818_t:CDS:2 [Acaulospora colombiana]|uniref:12818_t:CDS:1 n=1 Tax=Acaulospora colombiana TaxID=27376 RepID=A0ACA9M1B4_9GLOM|nr:12818_t:CDS:2 [Acaulospora colombiana]
MTIRESELMNTINAATAIIGQRSDLRQSVVSSHPGNSIVTSDAKSSSDLASTSDGVGVGTVAAHQSSTSRAPPISTIPEGEGNSGDEELRDTQSQPAVVAATNDEEAGGGSRYRGSVYESGVPYRARFPFVARDDELGFEVGDIIYVTDTSDEVWWKGAKDDGTGKFVLGFFPKTYVVPENES